MLSNALTFVEDPGHGWLQVPLDDLELLGIVSQISSCSYRHSSYAYLEEDRDMGIYLAALQAHGRPAPTIARQYVDHFIGRTSYARFR